MKYCGKIGFEITEDKGDGIWEPEVIERTYYGDVMDYSSRFQSTQNGTNEDIVVNNKISILADPFLYENFTNIRYADFMGSKLKVTNATVQRPRLILSLGGVYNG